MVNGFSIEETLSGQRASLEEGTTLTISKVDDLPSGLHIRVARLYRCLLVQFLYFYIFLPFFCNAKIVI